MKKAKTKKLEREMKKNEHNVEDQQEDEKIDEDSLSDEAETNQQLTS